MIYSRLTGEFVFTRLHRSGSFLLVFNITNFPLLNKTCRGYFTENCDECFLIQPGQSQTQVGYITCSCAPNGSDIRVEYSFDLSKSAS